MLLHSLTSTFALRLSGHHRLDGSPACDTAPGSFSCKLDHLLSALDWIAVALGIVLLLVAVLAYVIYRRNKHRKWIPRD